MGAWGTGIFDNDTACDWAGGLVDAYDLSLIEATLRRFLAEPDEEEGEEALAAAETVARVLGRPSEQSAYTEELDAWITREKPALNPALASLAVEVVELILASSEIRDLWEESDDFSNWQGVVEALRNRLQLNGI